MSRWSSARRLVPAILPMLALSWAARAVAATVVLVPPALPSAAMSEALARVQGELVSEGFSVVVVDAPREGDARAWIEQLGGRVKADAVVTLLGDHVPDSVEMRIVDARTSRVITRHLPFPSTEGTAAKPLAIHTLELVRATFLELDLLPASRSPPERERPHGEATLSSQTPQRISVDLGATAIFDLQQGAPSFLPFIRLSWAARPWLLPHLIAAGFGTSRTIHGEGASAQLSRQFALLGVAYRFRPAMRLRPFVSLSGGVLHVGARGQATPPDQGLRAERWCFLVDGALGAWLALNDRFQVALAMQAQLAQPYPALRFFGTVAETAARPDLLITATLGAWL